MNNSTSSGCFLVIANSPASLLMLSIFSMIIRVSHFAVSFLSPVHASAFLSRFSTEREQPCACQLVCYGLAEHEA